MKSFDEYMYRKNLGVYSNPINVNSYNIRSKNIRRVKLLQKPEIAIFSEIRNKIAGGKILDIGIGGGRTIEHLLNISKDYTGIDYSENMINECQKEFPDIDLRVCDARDMSAFDNEAFDFILFSFAGIDHVTNEDRKLILREIFRILKPDGYFSFSTHNRDYKYFNRFTIVRWETLTKTVYHNAKGLINFLINKKYCKSFEDHAIVNHSGFDYSLLLYSVSLKDQIDQLKETGFKGAVKVYDFDGNIVTGYSEHKWLYYCVGKNPLQE